MSEKTPQSFANHSKMVPGYHYVLFGILTINLLYAGWHLFQEPGLETGRQLVVGFAAVLMAWYLRIFPLTVQDRLIRLEMQLRLQKVLPADLAARVGELQRHHFVALRFAPDAELPELVRRVLGGELTSGKEIKQAIKNWQPDYLRC